MARKPSSDAARVRFAALLARHLTDGTRPATASGEPWTYAGFAAEVRSSREKNDFASPRSVSNWCKGTAFPAEIEPILRALFGPSARHEEAREALRKAFRAARDEKAAAVLAKAKPNRAGERWVRTEEGHAIDRTARPSDRRAAADPLRQQLQEIIRAHAAGLAERAKRLSNLRTWGGLATVAAAFEAVVRTDPLRMPDQLGTAYAHLLSLGRLLETDMRVQKDPTCADGPLDADIHGLLTDLVRTAAPWLRGFPTVAAWDDEAGWALVRPDLFQPARDFVRIARDQQAISAQDAAEVESLSEAAETESFQGSKAGTRLIGTARNLMVAEAEAVALDRVAAPATPPTARPLGVRRAQATLSAARPEWEAFSELLPPDLRQAVRAAADAGTEPDATVAAAADAAVPDDVEDQARDMILEGRAPPSPWRPFIRKLDLSLSTLSDLSLVAALTRLQSLNLFSTQVGDIASLAALTGLQSLDLFNTPVGDIAPLAALTELQSLDLIRTQVSDIAPLAALTGLRSLYLSDTPIGDIAPLAALTGLQSLDLARTQVGDIAPMAALTELQSLDLSGAPVGDIAPLATLTGLQSLDLARTQVGVIAPLATLTGLQSLDLSRTPVGDIAPLAALTGLQFLTLRETQVGDIAPLSALNALESLDLAGTRVSDVSPLSVLTNLQYLNLTGTQVRDISALSGLDVHIRHDIPGAGKRKPRPPRRSRRSLARD